MIEAAERDGRIEPGRTTIVEATVGQHRASRSPSSARRKGYDLRDLPAAGHEPRARGAAAPVRRDGRGRRVARRHERGRRRRARAGAEPRRRFLPDQFSNPANPEVHRRTTGPEILDALDGQVDVLVAGVGTGGTITGAGEALKAAQPEGAASSPSSRQSSPVLSGGAPGPAPDPGHRRRASSRRCSTATCSTRSSPVADEDAIETARAGAPAARACSPGISCGAALWARDAGRRAPGVAGQADRRASCPTRASATSPRRSSPRRAGRGPAQRARYDSRACSASAPSRRVAGELRRDVAPRTSATPPRAASAALEILASWPGVHALLAHRVAHALHEAGVPARPARARLRQRAR